MFSLAVTPQLEGELRALLEDPGFLATKAATTSHVKKVQQDEDQLREKEGKENARAQEMGSKPKNAAEKKEKEGASKNSEDKVEVVSQREAIEICLSSREIPVKFLLELCAMHKGKVSATSALKNGLEISSFEHRRDATPPSVSPQYIQAMEKAKNFQANQEYERMVSNLKEPEPFLGTQSIGKELAPASAAIGMLISAVAAFLAVYFSTQGIFHNSAFPALLAAGAMLAVIGAEVGLFLIREVRLEENEKNFEKSSNDKQYLYSLLAKKLPIQKKND